MRSIWSGTISFGLVSVGVRTFPATESKELLDLIRAKAKGKRLPEPEAEEEDEAVDLMTALRESVERTKKKRAKAS